MSLDFREITPEVHQQKLDGSAADHMWIRLKDTETEQIVDIDVHGQSIIGFWTMGAGRCDCVRYRAWQTARRQDMSDEIPCSKTRFLLLGIWTIGDEQVNDGD